MTAESENNPSIRVSVDARYLPEQSDAAESRYVFAYTITISNHGQEAAKLISRHWYITAAADHVQEVQGLGVIGEQPLIAPGNSYTYTSGAVLQTETGSMQGSYQFVDDNGESFDADIALFTLIPPRALH